MKSPQDNFWGLDSATSEQAVVRNQLVSIPLSQGQEEQILHHGHFFI